MSVVLLTGGTGFVGRQVLVALDKAGARVRAVIRSGSEARLPNVAALEDVIVTPDLFLESEAWWERTCRGVDRVVHVAWYAETGKYLESPKNAVCLQGTLKLARGSVASGVRRFVGIGTCFEYDVSGGILSIDSPLRPWTAYGTAKVAAYEELSRLLLAQGVSFAWCRLFYLYGEGEDENRLAPYLHRRLAAGQTAELTTGEQIRDYLDVAEAGRRIAAVAMSDVTGPINVCSGVPTTVRQFAETIADYYGRRNLLHFGARPGNLNDPFKVVGIANMTS